MQHKWKIFLVVGLVVFIGFIHYSCQLYLVQHTQIHNVILKAFYIPIVMAAFWWGLRGGLSVGFICAAIYSIDVFRWRTLGDTLLYNDFAEIILFIGVGALLGWLVARDRSCKVEKTKAEERAEREFHSSITDPLTQAFNRRYMDVVVEERWNRAQKEGEVFSLLMIDLNNFKFINDHYGHLLGDRVLQLAVQSIFKQIRKTDFLFRYGGDEFLILIPEVSQEKALALAERLRNEIAKLTFWSEDHSAFKADFSIGVIQYHPAFKDLREMLNKLDESLYAAKKESTHILFSS
jgi:diguanylate cyclase (GGDEF)-like protein